MTNPVPRIIHRCTPVYQISRDCDCACSNPVGIPFESAALAPGVLLRRTSRLVDIPLSGAYCAVAAPLGGGVAVLNAPARAALAALREPQPRAALLPAWAAEWGQTAADALYTGLVRARLLAPVDAPAPAAAPPHTLSAWLHITDRCNLRCAYCYLPHLPADMTPATGRAAIDAVVRAALRHGYHAVKLKYAGGEPLLRFALVARLHRYARAQAQEHGLELAGVVLSNGTRLTAEMVSEMRALCLGLMLSLDGVGGDAGDAGEQRPYADGRSSAGDALRAVDLARAGGLTPDISITVSGRSVAGLPALLRWVLARDLPFNLNFYRENDLSAPTPDLALEEQRIIDGMRAAYRVIEGNLPPRSLLAALVDRANLAAPHRHTCSAGQSYLVFDPHGRVSKCQMALDAAVTDITDPDPLQRIREDRTGLLNLPVDAKAGCRECIWRYWCGGGCPLQAYRAAGRYDARSPNCDIYRALYPEVVRLEGLRLLKYADAPQS
ncbi:MAG: SPASM domain-containing protein [Anaerolineae bacterium]|nr:SPASM domain-containing protein [Anaerolineae bacterium]